MTLQIALVLFVQNVSISGDLCLNIMMNIQLLGVFVKTSRLEIETELKFIL